MRGRLSENGRKAGSSCGRLGNPDERPHAITLKKRGRICALKPGAVDESNEQTFPGSDGSGTGARGAARCLRAPQRCLDFGSAQGRGSGGL